MGYVTLEGALDVLAERPKDLNEAEYLRLTAELARLRAAEAELRSIRDYMESFHEVETIENPTAVLASVHERITKAVGSSNDAD